MGTNSYLVKRFRPLLVVMFVVVNLFLVNFTGVVAAQATSTNIQFPLDEAQHANATEWWYYSGLVVTQDDQFYWVEYTIASLGLSPTQKIYVSQILFTDVRRKTSEHEVTMTAPTSFVAGGNQGANLTIPSPSGGNNWTMVVFNGRDTLKAQLSNNHYGFDLQLNDVAGIALHNGGEFSYGPGGNSFYYSRPNMEPHGTITVGSQAKRVKSGQLWLDHQWGDFTQAPDSTTFIGWDWFSVRLIDGSFLLVYRIRNAITGQLINTFGTYIPPQQGKKNNLMKVVPLTANDLTLKVNSTWKSPVTNTEWPLDWNIKVRAREGLPALEFNTNPIVADQEVQLGQFPPYWEGSEVVAGKKNQFPIGGLAHLESTGYSFLPPVIG